MGYDYWHWFDTNAGRPILYRRDEWRGDVVCWSVVGVAGGLLLNVLSGETPVGVLLDRLTECPEECACPEGDVRRALDFFRDRHPDGV